MLVNHPLISCSRILPMNKTKLIGVQFIQFIFLKFRTFVSILHDSSKYPETSGVLRAPHQGLSVCPPGSVFFPIMKEQLTGLASSPPSMDRGGLIHSGDCTERKQGQWLTLKGKGKFVRLTNANCSCH